MESVLEVDKKKIIRLLSLEREFLEAYALVSPSVFIRATPEGIIATNMSIDHAALVRMSIKTPVRELVEMCLEAKALLRGDAVEASCEKVDITPKFNPTAKAKLPAERLKLWISEAERIEADTTLLEAKEGRLRFYASGFFCDCWVEDYAQAEGEAHATYRIDLLKAAAKITKPALLEWGTGEPLHMRWETPRVAFSLYIAPLVE